MINDWQLNIEWTIEWEYLFYLVTVVVFQFSHSGCIHHELRGLGCGSSRIEEKQWENALIVGWHYWARHVNLPVRTSSPPRWSPPQSGAVITVQPVGGRTKTNATGHCRSMSDQSWELLAIWVWWTEQTTRLLAYVAYSFHSMTLQTLTKIARELNSAHQVTPSSNSSGRYSSL